MGVGTFRMFCLITLGVPTSATALLNDIFWVLQEVGIDCLQRHLKNVSGMTSSAFSITKNVKDFDSSQRKGVEEGFFGFKLETSC